MIIPFSYWGKRTTAELPDGLTWYVDSGNSSSYPGTGTTWFDLIGSRNLLIENSPTYTNPYFQTTNTFNGGHFVSSNFNGDNNPQLSVVIWYYPTSYSSFINNLLWLIAKRNTPNSINQDWQLILNNGRPSVTLRNVNTVVGTATDGSGAQLPLNEWSMVSFTTGGLNGNSLKVFLNGALYASTTLSNDRDIGVFDLYISRAAFNAEQQSGGRWREALLWNRELTDQEINDVYNITKGKYE